MEVHQRDADVAEISHKLDRLLSVDSEDTEDKMDTYHRLIKEGKNVGKQGDMKAALKFFKLAYKIHQSEKLENRINKIEEHLSELESEEDDDFVDVNGSGLMLFRELYDKLYDYQRDGVSFLYSLQRDGRRGGILADDMGLGKTIQVISFLSGMYDNELAKHTLLVMPTSLITNWTKEFAKWTPGMRVKEFHGTGRERTRNLEKVQRRSGVVITTYTMLLNNWQQLSSYNGREFTWDYMILDEAHKIKSTSTKTAKSASAIPSKNRVLLTGTPVQNNLKEMWALFDFACQGTLLGTAKTFKAEYENPITRAREKDSTPGEKALGSRMSENLMAIIKPYFLRRTKAEVQKSKAKRAQQQEDLDSSVQNPKESSGAVMPTLKRKNDLIVWTYLSPVQEDIYRQFISLDHIKELLMTTKSPLAELNIMKKLCDHPRLFSPAAIAKLGLEESEHGSNGPDGDACSIANVPDETLIAESGKLVFLFALLQRLREEGHRTLVFAHYRKVLDIIERILGNRGFKVMRLDGTITQIAERERLITRFQTDKSYSVFLLTTQVGGVGITLTAANRVVIYDPSWNPATDAQAVDRAYRIGQKENVVIYRLITCGTVEEKIYRRQVFKDSLIRQNTGDTKNPFRYFSKQELKELFILEDPRSSTTQIQLQELHARHRRTDPELDEHIAHLHTMEMFGISDHDLMFSLEVNHDEGLENQEEHHYIEGRVQKAQELMKAESELQMQLAENMASSTEPAWLRQPAPNTQEKKPRPSPSLPQQDRHLNGSPVVVDLDQTGSDQEDGPQTQSGAVIDLTRVESVSGEQEVENLDSPEPPQERSYLDTGGLATQEGVQEEGVKEEEVQESLMMSETSNAAGDASELKVESEPEVISNGSAPPALTIDGVSPPQNKRLSVLKLNTSSRPGSGLGSGLESFEGNFNLQLEESMTSADQEEVLPETEEEEQKLLSQLQMEGSFDVYKSLNERDASRSLHDVHANGADELDDSIIATKKKRAAVIYDSDEDEDDEGDKSHVNSSFQVLGASTPKSAPSGSTPLRSRKSIGGNTSVASRRSFIMSIIEDMDLQQAGEEEEEEEEEMIIGSSHSELEESGREEEEESKEIIGSSHNGLQLEESVGEEEVQGDEEEEEVIGSSQSDLQLEETVDEEEEEEIIGSSQNGLQLEESVGEEEVQGDEEEEEVIGSSHSDLQLEETVGEEEEDEDSEYADAVEDTEQESSSNMEESSGAPELSSDERMDKFTGGEQNGGVAAVEEEEEDFDSLVTRGKVMKSKGKLDDALSFFLRAIDLKPGDPEVQLITIQLYRQLSQSR